MLDKDIIEPKTSSWSSRVVLVKKKDAYSLSLFSDTLEDLVDAEWFYTLDLASGFWLVELVEGDT